MPADEVGADVELVRLLLAEQFPELATRSLAALANGWDNAVFRLGENLVVRLPRRLFAAELIGHEQRWLPELAPALPLPIPVPLFVGRPSPIYPWSWSITPFLTGRIAAGEFDLDLNQVARTLAVFLARLHHPAPADAPINPVRGVPLRQRTDSFQANLALISSGVDPEAAEALWRVALSAERWTLPPVWVHGDLHPANLLSDHGELVAVLDFGDLTAGDPATDLAVAWMLFPPAERVTFWNSYAAAAGHPVDAALQVRARGWALTLGTVFVARSADNPVMAAIGANTLEAVLTTHRWRSSGSETAGT